MKRIFLILFCLATLTGFAQRPKMHLKAKVGTHFLSYVYKQDSISRDYSGGIQGGFGFRIMHKKLMGEVDFDFIRSYITIVDDTFGTVTLKNNAFELPLTIGFVTRNKAILKHFLYGGIVTHFNVKSFVTFDDILGIESIRVKPIEFGVINPTFLMRIGTQLDIAMFNFDLNYSLGLNKSFKSNYRTQSHMLQFNVGLVF